MIGAAKYISELVNSPCANAFHVLRFFEEYGDRENGLLAAYLVYPFVLHPELSTVASRWRKLPALVSAVEKHAMCFAGFAQRVERYRTDTNTSVELLTGTGLIEVSTGLGVRVLANTSGIPDSSPARKLARLIGRYSLPTAYRCMGVDQL
jgi:hypothetical protein